MIAVSVVLLLIVSIASFILVKSTQKSEAPQATSSYTPELNPTLEAVKPEDLSTLSESDQLAIQGEADRRVAERDKTLDQKYPWLNEFPLQNENYFVYFDTDKGKFFGSIYTASEEATIKSQVASNFKDLGIDTTTYQVDWTIKP